MPIGAWKAPGIPATGAPAGFRPPTLQRPPLLPPAPPPAGPMAPGGQWPNDPPLPPAPPLGPVGLLGLALSILGGALWGFLNGRSKGTPGGAPLHPADGFEWDYRLGDGTPWVVTSQAYNPQVYVPGNDYPGKPGWSKKETRVYQKDASGPGYNGPLLVYFQPMRVKIDNVVMTYYGTVNGWGGVCYLTATNRQGESAQFALQIAMGWAHKIECYANQLDPGQTYTPGYPLLPGALPAPKPPLPNRVTPDKAPQPARPEPEPEPDKQPQTPGDTDPVKVDPAPGTDEGPQTEKEPAPQPPAPPKTTVVVVGGAVPGTSGTPGTPTGLPGAGTVNTGNQTITRPKPTVPTTPEGDVHYDDETVNGETVRATLAGIAAEVGKIEKKCAALLRRDPSYPDYSTDLLGIFELLNDVLNLLQGQDPGGSLRVTAPCDEDAEGNPLQLDYTFQPNDKAGAAIDRLNAIMDILSKTIQWRNKTCSGNHRLYNNVTVTALEVQADLPGVKRTTPLKKKLSYRMPIAPGDDGSATISAADHWEGFSWETGPIIVGWVSKVYGTIQVWGVDEDEAKGVIRHAHAHMGVDESAGEWIVTSSRNPRFGRVATVRAAIATASTNPGWPRPSIDLDRS